MVNDNGQSLEVDIKRLVEETRALSQENYRLLKKMHHHMMWDQVMSVIKIALIVVPLIFAYMYLGPMLKNAWSMYGSLFGLSDNTSQDTNTMAIPSGINSDILKNVSPELIKQLQESGVIDQYLQNVGR